MNAAIIDTNVLINCFQRGGGAADAISDYDRILGCPAVVAEFKAGIDTSTKRGGKAKDRLDEFLDDPAVEFVPCTEETAEYYARIFRALKDNGTPLPTNDIWIAAAALEHGATVLSGDGHFSLVPMLKVAN
jgi:tRNA(fMet)-specific endonuclease VapC